jgi:hypothetical protein
MVTEAAQVDGEDEGLARELAQSFTAFVGAVRTQQEQWCFAEERVVQAFEESQRELVGPLQIVQDQNQRTQRGKAP